MNLKTSDISAVAQGNTVFALDLYRELKANAGNLFFSPYSISTALAMTYAGARGETEEQMARSLHFTLDQTRLHPAFAALEAGLKVLQQEGHLQLEVANALWPQSGYPFMETFLALLQKNYGSSISPLDYRQTEAARQTINAWVEQRTQDKIKDLIQPGILDALTRLVLVNAIYFKGSWASPFDERFTEKAPFWLLSGQSIETPLMRQTQQFRYGQDDNLQILELPYIGQGLSMIILLPEQVDGLADLENTLTAQNLARWTECLSQTEIRALLPKFKLTSRFRLDDTLQSMGMLDAFNESAANFSGMDGRERWLYIGAVIHKAFVEVNEEGAEAAAATAVVIRAKGLLEPIPIFRADHPFVFLIRDNHTGSVLFLGRVVNPQM